MIKVAMAKTSALIQKLVSVTFLLTAISFISASAKSPSLVAQLIHRNSIESPYYNANASSLDRANQELKSSIARLSKLIRADTSGASTNTYQASLFTEDNVGFLAKIWVGNPPVEQLFLVDTASNLTWVQCQPCTNCYNQSIPIFDPSHSSSYFGLNCGLDCVTNTCDGGNMCIYNKTQLDGTVSSGNLAFESLHFKPTYRETYDSIDNVTIGCGHDNAHPTGPHSGVLGLGPTSAYSSLILKEGLRFSYCIGDISASNETLHKWDRLRLGDSEVLAGDPSPIETYNGLYYVSLSAIRVGNKWLDIDHNIFKRSNDTNTGGVIIDSGVTMSFLRPVAYKAVSDEMDTVLRALSVPAVPAPSASFAKCYSGKISDMEDKFPPVIFYFAEGATMVLGAKNVFVQIEQQFCMTLMNNPYNGTESIIGVRAQQFHHIAYNAAAKTISFAKISCDLL